MTPDDRLAFFQTLSQQNPEPCTELIYSTPFELLVAVILSAQATDVGVNKATRRLFPVANTPRTLLALGEETLKTYLNTLNLYRTKAKHIILTCQRLIDYHDSQVPSSREALEALPGVGRKTANVILNVIFEEATIAVDTHIFRVANRTGLASGKTPRAVEDQLYQVIPPQYLPHAHHWLVLHGRYICQARRPLCEQCPVNAWCDYFKAT